MPTITDPANKRTERLEVVLLLALPLGMTVLIALISHFILSSWWLELISFLMPIMLVAVLMLLVVLVIHRPRWPFWIPTLVSLLVGMKPMRETFSLNYGAPAQEADFTVMSFNAGLFNPYRPYTMEGDTVRYKAFYRHMREHVSPGILCIQEFFHSQRSDAEMAVDSILRLGGYHYFYTNPKYNKDYEGTIGVATFSKFPAVGSGKLEFGSSTTYSGHWIDLRIDDDTIRVVNFQLQSMSIRWSTMDPNNALRNVTVNLRHIHDRLRWGYIMRNRELSIIEDFLRSCPHKVIVCADINALPYSDTYQRLKDLYSNAFEERGSGFGFTYHHAPWFIRIDNQFSDPALGIACYRTRTDIRVSDHYPVEAGYVLPR